jgi:hypothetical protein
MKPTCFFPLDIENPIDSRCGEPATAVRKVMGAWRHFCAEHAPEVERLRLHGATPEELALSQALNEDEDEAAAMGPALRASREHGGP